MKGAHVSGMAAYQALCDEAEADYEGYWAAPGARARQLEDAVHQGARREQRAVLQVVRGRHAERLLQLPGPQRRSRPGRQDRDHLRGRRRQGHHASPTASCWPAPASWPTRLKSLRRQEGRPRRHLHVDERSRAWPRCRPARASAPPTRWCSAASRRSALRDRIAGRRRGGGDHRRRAAARRQAAAAEGHRRRGPGAGRLREREERDRLQAHRRQDRLGRRRATAGCTS